MKDSRILVEKQRFSLMMDRLCYQLIEEYNDFSDTCLIGVQHRGVRFADRLYKRLGELTDIERLKYGKLDITFYRDDFRTKGAPLRASATNIDFLIENKQVILVDDVLYTGRTIQAALAALQHHGRPRRLELVTLVDRRFNRHLPVQADYVGLTVDAIDEAYVKVEWAEHDGQDAVWLFPHREEADF